ncbi:uncharacterized protein LOC144907828 [Branchiostoma floridae x Branchiostoma belcheri]
MRGKCIVLAAVVLSVCGDVLDLYAAAAPQWSREEARRMEGWAAALVGRKPARYNRLRTGGDGEDSSSSTGLLLGRERREISETARGRVRTPRGSGLQVSTDLSMILLREMLKEARQKLLEEKWSKSRKHNQNLFDYYG